MLYYVLRVTVRRVTVLRMTKVKKSVLGSVRLDSDVWEAVRAMECSLNQYLRLALIDGAEFPALRDGMMNQGRGNQSLSEPFSAQVKQGLERQGAGFDPCEIPGVSVGPPKRETTSGYPCRCIHSGCRGSRFTGTSKFQNLCPECAEGGHKGEPRNCQACADDSASGAL